MPRPSRKLIPVTETMETRERGEVTNLSEEDRAKIAQTVKIVKASGRGRLPEEIIFDVLKYSAEGLSTEKIVKLIAKKYDRILAPSTVANYQKKFAPRIREISDEWEREAITAGLSKRGIRVKKLQRLAEAVENGILDEDGNIHINASDLKLISEYRELLKQISLEVGDTHGEFAGDLAFIGISDEELLKLAAGSLSKNKDLAVIMAEKAGVRPGLPSMEIDEDGDSGRRASQTSDGVGETEEG